MPITQVGTGTGAAGTYGTGFNVAAPGTLAASDVVVVALRTEKSSAHSFSAPAGFTEIVNDIDTANNVTALHVFVGDGFTGSGSFAFTATGLVSGDWVARTCTAWSGTSLSDYVLGTLYSASPGGANFDIPGVTTTSDNAELLCLGAQTFTSGPRTYSPTMTTQVHSNACYQASRAVATAGASGVTTVTNTAFVSAVFVHLALHETPPSLPSPPLRSHPRLGLITR